MKIKKVLYAIHKSFLCSGAGEQSLLKQAPLCGQQQRDPHNVPYAHLVLLLRIDGDATCRSESLQSQQLQYGTWIERTSTHVHEKEQATDDRQCLEEIVPGDAKASAKDN